MLEADSLGGDDNGDLYVDSGKVVDSFGAKEAWDARRRIERLRELRRLRELLGDPDFNELY